MHLSWYTLLFGAAITATLPRLRSTRFADELRAGNSFLTAVALLKVLFDAKEDRALSGVELARRVRTTPDDAEVLLEKLERLGYVRRLVASRPGRRGGQDWMLTCDPAKVSLRPVFERFAVDPGNTLLTAETLGLGPLMQHWLASDWINAPIADSLSAPPVAQEAVALQGVAFRQVQR
jgi:membrane protein